MANFFSGISALLFLALIVSVLVETCSALTLRKDLFERKLLLKSNSKFWCKWNPSWCIQCPKVRPVDNFDVDRYIEKSWYVQKQQVNPYQAEDQLFCVSATYSKQNSTDLLKVDNYANQGEVNGPNVVADGLFSDLCAKQKREGTGQLAVAPCFFDHIQLFDVFAGPYWVLALDEANYSWAIVSGGQPTKVKQEDPTLCTTKEGNSFFDINGSGLWLFTREREATTETIQMMESKLLDLGVYTGSLKDVNQTGCNYEGANLKL